MESLTQPLKRFFNRKDTRTNPCSVRPTMEPKILANEKVYRLEVKRRQQSNVAAIIIVLYLAEPDNQVGLWG